MPSQKKKTATPAPGSLLPTCHHGRQRMELCQCKQRTQYSLETAGSVASSLLGHRWLIRDDNYVSCFLLSASEGVSFISDVSVGVCYLFSSGLAIGVPLLL